MMSHHHRNHYSESEDQHQTIGKRRVLVSTAALPAMCTICNGLAGFGAIHFATKDALGEATPHHLMVSAWLIVVAMFFDMLDGRVARMTRRTSDFGAQLDSMCDVISFGVAPAMLMLRTVTLALRGEIQRMLTLPSGLALERVIWCVAGAYVACAVLRLARFNVETDSDDESAHMNFVGLPSPGAAAAVVGLVLLLTYLVDQEKGWQSSPWILTAVGIALPIITLLAALLMVSNIEYPHVVNQYLRNRKPFGFLVKGMLLIIAMVYWFYFTAAVIAMFYALSAPIHRLTKRFSKSSARVPAED